jgi:hypothetical protein
MKAIFKSLVPIEITTERGIDFVRAEGTVMEEFTLKVLCTILIYLKKILKTEISNDTNKLSNRP